MTDSKNANSQLHEGTNLSSPFTRVLGLGYYDGPTSGIVECGSTGQQYKFDILSWDVETQELRVFALAPLPSTAFQRLTDAYQRFWEPRWPIWVPMWNFPTEADQIATERLTKEVLEQAGPKAWAIATTDLLGEILAAKKVTEQEIGQVSDWGSFFGLPGQSVSLPGGSR